MKKEFRRKLRNMPFDKVFENEYGQRENCHATGYEVCDSDHDPKDAANWWNEYRDAEGNLYYGR